MRSSFSPVAADSSNVYDTASNMLLDTDVFSPFIQKSTFVGDANEADLNQTPPTDLIATQVWKFFTKTKQRLPNQQRVENLAWRMMSSSIQAKTQRDACNGDSNQTMDKRPSGRSQQRNRPERTWDPLKLNSTQFVAFSENKPAAPTSHWRWSGFNLDEIQPVNSTISTPSVDPPRRSSYPTARPNMSTLTRRKGDDSDFARLEKKVLKRPADVSFDTTTLSNKKANIARMDLGTTPYEDMLERILHGTLPDTWNSSASTFTSGDYSEAYPDNDFLSQQDFALSCSMSANQMFELGSSLSDSSNFLGDHSSPLIPESVSSSGSDLSIPFSNTTLPQPHTNATQENTNQYMSHLANLVTSATDCTRSSFDNEAEATCSNNSHDNMSPDWLNTQLGETDAMLPTPSLEFTTGNVASVNSSTTLSRTSSNVGKGPDVPTSAAEPVVSPSTPKPASPDTSKAQQPNGYNPMTCVNCSTQTTPLWRRDPSGKPMCNACGLFLKLHGVLRPLSLKTNVIRKRRRGAVTKPTFGVAGTKSKNTNDAATVSQETQPAHGSMVQNVSGSENCITVFDSDRRDSVNGSQNIDNLSTNLAIESTSSQAGPCSDILETQKMLLIDEESLNKSAWGDSTSAWWSSIPPRLGQSRCSSSSESTTPGLTDQGNWKWLTLSL